MFITDVLTIHYFFCSKEVKDLHELINTMTNGKTVYKTEVNTILNFKIGIKKLPFTNYEVVSRETLDANKKFKGTTEAFLNKKKMYVNMMCKYTPQQPIFHYSWLLSSYISYD